MSTLMKTLLAVAATMLISGAAYAATAPAGHDATTAPAATDVKGPCDEPEHATNPRCASPQVPEDRPNEAENENENEPNDIGGDNPGEAERHDNRGPGSLNSGPGNAEDRGDDGGMEDNSGSGGSGHG